MNVVLWDGSHYINVEMSKENIEAMRTALAAIEEPKHRYRVSLNAEGNTMGTIELTQREADLVEFATDPDSWRLECDEQWSGSFRIDTEPIRE